MARIIVAPEVIPLSKEPGLFSIFLAGSIENGKAVDWQDKLSNTLSAFQNVIVFNPRRKHWDPDLDHRRLTTQILWEQTAIQLVDLVVFYFDPETQSPISLLELGLCLGSHKKVIVFCPPTFFRFTNVDVTCQKYKVQVHSDYHTFVAEIIGKISQHI